ncbi:MAG: beta-lactamase family protein [Oscillospiraceae bacterium]|nr:beta-lactamase family protein [Oscillospiraceae bacterium]
MEKTFHGTDLHALLKLRGAKSYGVSLALAKGGELETFCAGSGRFGQDFPVEADMLFQAASVSKPMFAMTLLRYVDKGLLDLDADVSGVVPEFAKSPLSFSALLSHTAGFNVHGFPGYRADHAPLTLEDVLSGRGNTPRIRRIKPCGKQFMYSGGGITLAQLAFERLTGTTLREAFAEEIAAPLGLERTGFFQPLDGDLVSHAAFGGRLAYREDPAHGYHYYPEHAAAGMWTTPTELTKLGLALSRSVREGGLLKQETARRMVTPVLDGYGLCIGRDDHIPDQVCHTGGNEGFISYWTLSLTQDLCAAVMFNGSNRLNDAVSGELFGFVDRLIEEEKE